MVEKIPVCPSCGAEIEPHLGPGRPPTYCSVGCRRLAEFRIRALARRLDKAEIELRELRIGSGFFSDDDRRQRIRAVRRWIKQDSAKLNVLLGGNKRKNEQNNQITAAPRLISTSP